MSSVIVHVHVASFKFWL